MSVPRLVQLKSIDNNVDQTFNSHVSLIISYYLHAVDNHPQIINDTKKECDRNHPTKLREIYTYFLP